MTERGLVDRSFEEHRRQVYAWAYRMLGHDHDSQDVVQEVFLKWERQCRTERPDQPRGWLRRVTLNCAIDACRKNKRADKHGEEGLLAEASYEPSLGAAGDCETLRREVAAALNGLTDAQRSVVVAKVYDELTFAEIAAEHELAVSTVKTHYVRGIRALSQRLHRWDEDQDCPKGSEPLPTCGS